MQWPTMSWRRPSGSPRADRAAAWNSSVERRLVIRRTVGARGYGVRNITDLTEQPMTYVTDNQPDGTPTWIDLGIPDLERAMEFYRALFGWEYDVGSAEYGHYTTCLLHDRPVAALLPNPDPNTTDFWWNVYFATDDCDGTAKRITEAGGALLMAPMDVMDQGRMASQATPSGPSSACGRGARTSAARS
jgi:predicted enzyme related to lactoylglutathione lyase